MPDSDATIKWLTTPNNYSIYIENGTAKGRAVDLVFTFTKTNLKMEGKNENESTLNLTVQPGADLFILFEKVNPSQASKIKFNYKYSTAKTLTSEHQVI